MQCAAVITYKSLTSTPPQNPPRESLVFLNGPVLWSAAIQGNSLCAVGNPLTILAIGIPLTIVDKPILLGIPQPKIKLSLPFVSVEISYKFWKENFGLS